MSLSLSLSQSSTAATFKVGRIFGLLALMTTIAVLGLLATLHQNKAIVAHSSALSFQMHHGRQHDTIPNNDHEATALVGVNTFARFAQFQGRPKQQKQQQQQQQQQQKRKLAPHYLASAEEKLIEVGPMIPPRLVNGNVVADADRFAFHSEIILNGTGPLCGASLVAPYWVLTAAHCLREVRPPRLLEDFAVVVAAKVSGVSSADQRVAIASTHIHPRATTLILNNDPTTGYNNTVTPRFDFALVKLTKPVFGIRPAIPDDGSVLPQYFRATGETTTTTNTTDTDLQAKNKPDLGVTDRPLLSLGTGRTSPDSRVKASQLESMTVAYVSSDLCDFVRSNRRFRKSLVCLKVLQPPPPSQPLGPKQRPSWCFSDSGAALVATSLPFAYHGHPAHQVNNNVMVGLTSVGNFPLCQTRKADKPFGAARVSIAFPWMQKVVCRDANRKGMDPNARPEWCGWETASACPVEPRNQTFLWYNNRHQHERERSCRWLRKSRFRRFQYCSVREHWGSESNAAVVCPRTCGTCA